MLISIFESISKAYILATEEGDWPHIAEYLSEHQPIKTKEKGLLFNLARFKVPPEAEPGRKYHYLNKVRLEEWDEIPNTVRRCKNNLIEIYGIVLDVDDNLSIDTVIKNLEGLEYLIFTTFRHTIEKHKFRVIIPFSTALKSADIRHYQDSIKETFPGVDNASFTASQSFYFHSGLNDNIVYHNKGVIINPYDFEYKVIKPVKVYDIKKTATTEEVLAVLDTLKKHYDKLDYYTRRNVTWALMSQLQKSDAIQALRSRWSDQQLTGKYESFANNFIPNKISMGSIVHLIRVKDASYLTTPPITLTKDAWGNVKIREKLEL